jgi:hypothetical protein
MIKDPSKITDTKQPIRMLIAGYPGIGKSTLALSAPNPLHIDLDFGIDRVDPRYRKPYIQPASYDEIRHDLAYDPTMSQVDRAEQMKVLNVFDTLVFDTGGKLITLIGDWAVKSDPKNGRSGGLSLKGYGVVGREFVKLMDHCFRVLHKNIVIVFHTVEEKDGDNTKLRIKVEGQTKNNVWESMDLGGFMEMFGNDRTIGFSNCERYYAKGTHGIHGVYKLPELVRTDDKGERTYLPNTFLTDFFANFNATKDKEIETANQERAAYDEAMTDGKQILEAITDADSMNAAIEPFSKIQHALTSKAELECMWSQKVHKLGLKLNKDKKYEVR